MNNVQKFIKCIEDELISVERMVEYCRKAQPHSTRYYEGQKTILISMGAKARLLLCSDTGASTETAISQTQMLGEVPPEVECSTINESAAVSGATPAVRQNEQTKEDCYWFVSERRTGVCDRCGRTLAVHPFKAI